MRIAVDCFETWRHKARRLLAAQVPPEQVEWVEAPVEEAIPPAVEEAGAVRVSKPFLSLVQTVACHRNPDKWGLMYRALWRMAHGDRFLLEMTADDDVHWLLQMEKQVRRDSHKMKAFVRFRRVGEGPSERFVAWYRPDHHILRRVVPFFQRRYKTMPWVLLTPDESAIWDRQELRYSPGVAATTAPTEDELDEIWARYYAEHLDPSPVKPAVVRPEAPLRHWPTMPEMLPLDEFVRDAPERAQAVLNFEEGSTTEFLPRRRTLAALAEAATGCPGCDLHLRATQTVFGEGPSDAEIVLVGEQPGDVEDVVGRPFVGPAGKVLDEMLRQAGIDRERVYVTNAVKHFKWTADGRRRLHKKPDSREITACRPWLKAELLAIRPKILVCLGATAAQSLIGRDFRITRRRGEVLSTEWAPVTIATWHPSAILRAPEGPQRDRLRAELLDDLRRAVEQLNKRHERQPVAC